MQPNLSARGRARALDAARRVLVVEHTQDVADLLAAVLGEEGYDVECLLVPVTIAEELRRRQASLLIIDVPPPMAEASRLLEELRARPADVRVPVLVTTTYAPLLKVDLAAYGVDGVIAKPFDLDDLLVAVRQTMPPGISANRALKPAGSRAGCLRFVA